MRRKNYQYIDNTSDLAALTDRLEQRPTVALDTEADSLHHYFEKVCLIQITLDDKSNYLIDPLADMNLKKFLKALSLCPLILHNADYDLRMLHTNYQFKPAAELFDTVIAGQLLGFQRLGLLAMAEDMLSVTLSKKGQKSDWSKRPLTTEQKTYAIDDTRYLHELAEKLRKKLEKLGRLEWLSQTVDRVIEATRREKAPPDPEKLWRIKGLRLLEPEQLNYVRAIWRWRDAEARRADLPSFKILGNQEIVQLACWSVDNPHASLENHGPRLPRHCTGSRLARLKKSLSQACEIAPDKWPKQRKSMEREPLTAEFKKLRTDCDKLAGDLGIDPGILASRATLHNIIAGKPSTVKEVMNCGPLVAQWQGQFLLDIINSNSRSQ